jgi:hypothetical protein
MSVYVDKLFSWSPEAYTNAQAYRNGARYGHLWCHLLADSVEELHAMAKKLGLKRSWYHNYHYNLLPPKREQAIKLGAIEVDRYKLSEILRRNRATGPSGR